MQSGASSADAAIADELQDDPKTKLMLSVPVSEIDLYDKNPRREENPNYEKIKESISNNGMNQPLVITKRPGDGKFIIFKGGNTRLAAIRELYKETGDRQFKFADCCFCPWTGEESDAIIGHLQENEMRKSLCFFDRANGVKLAIDYLKDELDQPDMSLRECLALLTGKGYTVTLSTLSIMLYAVTKIDPILPYELLKTMGRPQIQRIRKLEGVSKKVCDELEIDESSHLLLFEESLKAFDEPSWSYRMFRRELESRIAVGGRTSIQDVSLRIDGYQHLDNTPLSRFPTSFGDISAVSDMTEWPESRSPDDQNTAVYSVNTLNSDGDEEPDQRETREESEDLVQPSEVISGASLNSGRISESQNNPKSHQSKRREPEAPIDALRKQSHASAWAIAKRFGFHEDSGTKHKIVANVGAWGLGYLITDFPPKLQSDDIKTGLRDAMWWLLFEMCDMHWALESAKPLTAKIASNGRLLDYIRTGDSSVLYRQAKQHLACPYPFLGLYAMCARRVDSQIWSEVDLLTETYRSIHQLAVEQNIHLFQQLTKGGQSLS